MIRCQMNAAWPTVVEMRECNLVLSTNLVAYHYFVYIVELIPIFILVKLVLVKRFKLRTTGYRYI